MDGRPKGPRGKEDVEALTKQHEDRVTGEARIWLARIREDLPANFSTVEFADWLGRHRNQPVQWIKSGKLKGPRLGRKHVINAEDAAEFMARQAIEGES